MTKIARRMVLGKHVIKLSDIESGVLAACVCALIHFPLIKSGSLTLKVLVTTIDAQWEGMGDVGLARYEPALLPPCPTIRVFKLQ